MITVHKIKLYPVGDKEEVNRVYQFIRDGQYCKYQALNLLMGQYASKFYECNRDLNSAEFKEYQKTNWAGAQYLYNYMYYNSSKIGYSSSSWSSISTGDLIQLDQQQI